MKNIIVITDSAKIADVEFKSLRQRLMDKELLVKSDAMHWTLYTQQLMILFSSKLTNESKEAVLTLEYGENPCTTITNVYTVESGNKLIEY